MNVSADNGKSGVLDFPMVGRSTLSLFFSATTEADMEFIVADMSCGGCANAISRAIAGIDATATVQVDIGAKTVTVESALNQAQIASVISAAGFHPTVAEA
jgi:copper chaperone